MNFIIALFNIIYHNPEQVFMLICIAVFAYKNKLNVDVIRHLISELYKSTQDNDDIILSSPNKSIKKKIEKELKIKENLASNKKLNKDPIQKMENKNG